MLLSRKEVIKHTSYKYINYQGKNGGQVVTAEEQEKYGNYATCH
jgi:hypothetical protein